MSDARRQSIGKGIRFYFKMRNLSKHKYLTFTKTKKGQLLRKAIANSAP